jgi:hypothetical protein
MDYDLAELLDEYDDNTQQVSDARHAFFIDRLRQWFYLIDHGDVGIAQHIRNLEQSSSWDDIASSILAPPTGMVGSGKITVPPDPASRLSMYLNVFRGIESGKIRLLDFVHDYFYAGKSIDDCVLRMSDQFFKPFARELRRFIQKNFDEPIPDESSKTDKYQEIELIPASDRIVPINHNAPEYRSLISGLEGLEEQLRGSNEVDEGLRSRAIAEVQASQKLLQAESVRLDVARGFVIASFVFLSTVLAETLIGQFINQNIMPALQAVFPRLLGHG